MLKLIVGLVIILIIIRVIYVYIIEKNIYNEENVKV